MAVPTPASTGAETPAPTAAPRASDYCVWDEGACEPVAGSLCAATEYDKNCKVPDVFGSNKLVTGCFSV